MNLELVLITGMSGSGKSVALRALEDAGYYCVDNLPPELLLSFVALEQASKGKHVAIAMDVRSATSLPQVLLDAFAFRSRTVRRRFNSATCVFARALSAAVLMSLRAVRARRSCSCAAAFSPWADAAGVLADCGVAGGCAVLCAAAAGGSASNAAAVAVTVHAAVERFISVAPPEKIS